MKNQNILNNINLYTYGSKYDRNHKTPLTWAYRLEYALFACVSDLFAEVRGRSFCLDTLNLYFKELPLKTSESGADAGKKKTQTELLAIMSAMVNRDVTGNITFPMMRDCAAEVRVLLNSDGTHTFEFGDGIYGFRVWLDKSENGRFRGIGVRDVSNDKTCVREYNDKRGGDVFEDILYE